MICDYEVIRNQKPLQMHTVLQYLFHSGGRMEDLQSSDFRITAVVGVVIFLVQSCFGKKIATNNGDGWLLLLRQS